MNAEQIQLSQSWEGAHDERYFDRLRALDSVREPAPLFDDLADLPLIDPDDLEPVRLALARDADDLGLSPPVRDLTIGTRTAADLRHGPPLPQLVGPFLSSEGATVLYGPGGTGKGMVACHLIAGLVAADHVVMVVDSEGHPREWGARLRGLGMSEDALSRVHYRAPFDLDDWTAPTGPLVNVAPLIRADATRLGITYLVVDSYSVSTSSGDTMGGLPAAQEYFGALKLIGRPSLTLAHVTGGSGRFPVKPFGSIHIHNQARETWAVESLVGDEPETDRDLIQFGPKVVDLELRNMKCNDRAKAAAQFLTFSFHGNGDITVNDLRPGGRNIADLVADALADGPMTTKAIAAAVKEDTGEAVTENALRVTFGRHTQRFHQVGTTRPKVWGVR